MEIKPHAPLALLKANQQLKWITGGMDKMYRNLQIPKDTRFLIIDKVEFKICLLYLTFPTCLQYYKAFIMKHLKHYVKFMPPEKQMLNISLYCDNNISKLFLCGSCMNRAPLLRTEHPLFSHLP